MKGEVVYLYAFDVANEIVTAEATRILGLTPVKYTVRTDQRYPRELPLYEPLAVEPPELPSPLFGRPVKVLVRVYDVGVVTIAMRVAVDITELTELLPFHVPVLADGRALDGVARELCAGVCEDLKPYLRSSAPPSDPEAYTVFCLTDLGGLGDTQDAGAWLEANSRDVAGLLSETPPARLSESQVVEVLRMRYAFETSDVVVIDWDAALVVDLTGYNDDVLYVLELANLQLEEFRVMDERLDRHLDRAYGDLERRRFGMLGAATPVLRVLRTFRIDLTKLADEVTHITKFLGDWYLARVYLGARERFHLERWRASVQDRLEQLDQLYQVLHADIAEQRMLWLEVIIVLLFVIDLVLIFLVK